MGVYYVAVNHKNKEYLDPGKINGQGIKWGAMIYGDIGKLIVLKLITDEWDNVKIIGDSNDDEYYKIFDLYKDITEETVSAYNEDAGNIEHIVYAPTVETV